MARIEREMGSANIVRNLDDDNALEELVRDNYEKISEAINNINMGDSYTELRAICDTNRARREIDENDPVEFYSNMFSEI